LRTDRRTCLKRLGLAASLSALGLLNYPIETRATGQSPDSALALGSTAQSVETTKPLGPGEKYTGKTWDCADYVEFAVSAYVESSPGTLSVENSHDGVSWRLVDSLLVAPNYLVAKIYPVTRRFMRVRYENGTQHDPRTQQTVFELVTSLRGR